MCKWSEELKKQIDAEVGQKLVATSVLTQHGGITLAFAEINRPKDCEEGVCLRSGWKVLLHFTPKQIEALALPKIGDETGAWVSAEFQSGHHRSQGVSEPDFFNMKINGKIHSVNFCRAFRGVRMNLVASPEQNWPKAIRRAALPRRKPQLVA